MTAEQDKLRSMRKTLEFSVTPWNGFRRAMAVVVRPFARPGMRHKEKVLLFSPLLGRFYSKYAIAVFVDLVSIVEREDSREITYFGTRQHGDIQSKGKGQGSRRGCGADFEREGQILQTSSESVWSSSTITNMLTFTIKIPRSSSNGSRLGNPFLRPKPFSPPYSLSASSSHP